VEVVAAIYQIEEVILVEVVLQSCVAVHRVVVDHRQAVIEAEADLLCHRQA
jgi:hypothetical protein